MQKLNEAIDKFLSDSEQLSLKTLFEEVEKAIDLFGAQQSPVEDVQQLSEEEEKKLAARTYTIKEIPYLPISELGWANNEKGAQGQTQRSQLEDFLKRIQGSTMQEKLNNVTAAMNAGFPDPPEDKMRIKEYISDVMSHLVFYKSLTMAITNFNASAAGFNFEAFLAALMGGEQIPAAQEGDSTIADFVTGDGIPISLKLYTEGQLKVGGSYRDLCNDMINPKSDHASWVSSNPEFLGGGMKYVVCTKEFGSYKPDETGKDAWTPMDKKERRAADQRELHGKIRFYEFDITRENMFRTMSQSKHGTLAIMSAKHLMEELSAWDGSEQGVPSLSTKEGGPIPMRADDSRKAIEEIVDQMVNHADLGMKASLAPKLKEIELNDDQSLAIMNKLKELYSTTLLSQENNSKKDPPQRFQTYILNRNPESGNRKSIRRDLETALEGSEVAINAKQLIEVIDQWWIEFKDGYLKKIDAFTDAINNIEWESDASRLIEWYDALGSDSLGAAKRAIAIRNTRGYLTTEKWEIGDKIAKKLGTKGEIEGGKGKAAFPPVADIEIGAPAVQKVLDKVRNDVMNEVFAVFENMQAMAEQLNTFFATGLKDPEGSGKAGVTAGETATKTAREVGDIK